MHTALRSQGFGALPKNRIGFRTFTTSFSSFFFVGLTVKPLCAKKRTFHRICIPILFRDSDTREDAMNHCCQTLNIVAMQSDAKQIRRIKNSLMRARYPEISARLTLFLEVRILDNLLQRGSDLRTG